MRTPRKPGTRKARFVLTNLAIAALAAIPSTVAAASISSPSDSAVKPTIVLGHGAWADGSSWSGVVTRLQKDGYTVDVPPNPLRGPDSDAACLASYLATVPGPVVLVGHSYGGFVTTRQVNERQNAGRRASCDAGPADSAARISGHHPGRMRSGGRGPRMLASCRKLKDLGRITR